MTRSLLAALVLALGSLSCGGRTGLNIRIDPPREFRPDIDFNKIYVQASAETKTVGETVPISQATTTPYRVIIWGEDGATFRATVQVQLQKDAQIVKDKIINDIPFVEGELKEVVFSWE